VITIDVNKIKAIIFDCDGILVDSMPLHLYSWDSAFRQVDADFWEEFLLSAFRMKETEVVKLYNQVFNAVHDPEAIIRFKHEHFYSTSIKLNRSRQYLMWLLSL
jgi:beta-phosphoglucomutase-like phosphatase (HAD superfamily)